ncbi:hypothetical protein ABE210_20650 [Bacillus sonorensis]|uniref:response regulator aspartate phosphatase n=1 Tax=Bacillus sonorensis TaxID=119858 RepID=UPI003D1F9E89
MAAKIVDEKIGNMLNEWYKSLKENKLTKASEWRKVIEMLLPQIKENRHLSHYFELLDSRFTQLTEHFNRSGHVLQEGVHTKTDHMLQYYFYFFSGMYQFDQKNFLKAIDFFRITEQKLANIDDEIEKAEFHYHLSIVYYKIRQNYFSLSHAEKAFDSFKAHGSYLAKTLKCEMVIAANEADLTLQAAFYHKTRGDSDIAVKYFEEACKAKDQMLALIEESSSPASTRGSTIA